MRFKLPYLAITIASLSASAVMAFPGDETYQVCRNPTEPETFKISLVKVNSEYGMLVANNGRHKFNKGLVAGFGNQLIYTFKDVPMAASFSLESKELKIYKSDDLTAELWSGICQEFKLGATEPAQLSR
ncbi:MAG TPA: hypothetical protein VE954_14930 [Oligoflexus sp.]|uniref:hypothetical protein n=1 Tax=Oligoflexus sp. TaxID=1971216 RepID=UPI002D551173|nr:hypothetical protein [Oligoflexus sp.]HYX34396.1 hypothetical protein [Oligoflexus sp.]